MKGRKAKFSVSIDKELVERMRVLAEEDSRSLSSWMEVQLRKAVESAEEDKGNNM